MMQPGTLTAPAAPVPHFILGMRVEATDYARATDQIVRWAREGTSRSVCAANVHMVMEAFDDPAFRAVVNGADLVTSDGVPLVWALKALGVGHATRVYGPDLTLHVCRAAAAAGLPIGLYGGTPDSLDAFTAVLAQRFPGLQVACRIAPPFRPPTPEEDAADTAALAASGARIVFVGIGCPKQEKWMAAHRDRLPAVMLGVGAAFDFHAGRVRQAPAWMQRAGLEWLFRLLMEPRRLWKRYAKQNPRFLYFFLRQWLATRPGGPRP
jgi:N-acetylglucosaminyldiphosphoundecaprenol N-acetyl-beta-D-mannosaminyltransferase